MRAVLLAADWRWAVLGLFDDALQLSASAEEFHARRNGLLRPSLVSRQTSPLPFSARLSTLGADSRSYPLCRKGKGLTRTEKFLFNRKSAV